MSHFHKSQVVNVWRNTFSLSLFFNYEWAAPTKLYIQAYRLINRPIHLYEIVTTQASLFMNKE
jgi:hypothetical protein